MEKQIIPMNEVLFDDFFVNELEERLETDPLGVAGMFNLAGTADVQSDSECFWTTDCQEGYKSCIIN